MKVAFLRLVLCGVFLLPAVSARGDESVSLFDGESLAGWKGIAELWTVHDGAIVGSTRPGGRKGNTFLIHERRFTDFELELDFRLLGGNSGIQIRSQQIGDPDGFVVAGYQADIGAGYFGSLYEERRRGMLQQAPGDLVKAKFLKGDDWNHYVVRAQGKHITLTLNGLITAEYEETDSSYPRSGLLALQLHGGGPMEVQFKNIRIRELKRKKLLYVTTAATFPHKSRPRSREVVTQIGLDSGIYDATVTDSTDRINAHGLEEFDALMFYTTGPLENFPLRKDAREYMIDWVRRGHAFIGVHSATDTFNDWEPYWDMIGGTFDGHPWNQEVQIDVEDPSHPAAQPVPYGWRIEDEIYQFRNFSRDRVHVILSMNDASVGGKGKREDKDYPIAWCRDFGDGSVFYTSLGHRESVWESPTYQAHLLGGIRWALGLAAGNATPGLAKPSNDFVPLLDGKTLSGWTPNVATPDAEKKFEDKVEWYIAEDGSLTGRGKHGHLFSPKEYENFHYRAEVKVGENGNSGMYFRTQKGKPWPAGFEAQVNSTHGDPVRSGSLYGIHKEFRQLVPNDTWFTQDVVAYGNHIVIKVNGKVTADVIVPAPGREKMDYRRGHFALQYHDPEDLVWYRNIEVRELPAVKDCARPKE